MFNKVQLLKLQNGIYATAMDMFIKDLYEELEDDDMAEIVMNTWLMEGVADGNDLTDNINDFACADDYNDLHNTFLKICKYCKVPACLVYYVEKIKENIAEMLDNPYYFVV